MIGLATVEAINKLIGQKDGFLTILKENIEIVISETDNNIVAEIDKKLEELQKDLLRLANSKEDYNNIADEIYRLREETVSYTHLDVYKRQVYGCTGYLSPCHFGVMAW